MFRTLTKLACAVGLMTGLFAAVGSPSVAGSTIVGHVQAGPSTSVPFGWVDFCQRYQGECDTKPEAAREIEFTARSLREIERINRWVNDHIKPMSDMEHWGVVDQWDYPTDGYGDCEDYALLKRKLLAEQGFPLSALLMTVVRDRHDEGHAILMVRTDRGDFMLDNLNDEVKSWRDTGYRFVKRQSQAEPNVWVSLLDGAAPALASR